MLGIPPSCQHPALFRLFLPSALLQSLFKLLLASTSRASHRLHHLLQPPRHRHRLPSGPRSVVIRGAHGGTPAPSCCYAWRGAVPPKTDPLQVDHVELPERALPCAATRRLRGHCADAAASCWKHSFASSSVFGARVGVPALPLHALRWVVSDVFFRCLR